jgi:hypothetical protein
MDAPAPIPEAVVETYFQERAEEPSASTPRLWEAAAGAAVCASGTRLFLNFRKEDLAYKNSFANVLGDVLFAACLALLLLGGWWWYHYEERAKNLVEETRLQARIDDVRKQVEALQAKGINVPMEVFNVPSLLDILAEIAKKMPDSKATLTELKIEPPDSRAPWIAIQGEVKDDPAYTSAIQDLKQSALFQMDEDPERKMDGGKSTFVLTAKHKGSKAEGAASSEPEAKR